jgi:isoleucyl-tRNA synthetase
MFPETPEAWRNEAEAERWGRIEQVLAVVTAALEVERREKRIGGALEAAAAVHIGDGALLAAFDGIDPAEVFRTSDARLIDWTDKPAETWEAAADLFRGEASRIAVNPSRADGLKCQRSWKVLPEVEHNLAQHGLQLTDRDLDGVRWWDNHNDGREAA